MKKSSKKEERVILKKPLNTAGIALVSIAVFFTFSIILGMLSSIFISILSVLSLSLIFFVFTGFYYLGKRYKSEKFSLLTIGGFIMFILVMIISSSFSGVYLSKIDSFLEQNNIVSSDFNEIKSLVDNGLVNTQDMFKLVLPAILVYLLVAILITAFNISLRKLTKVEHVKQISLSNIISIWIIFIPFGYIVSFFLLIYSYILTTRMFFNESKKAKE